MPQNIGIEKARTCTHSRNRNEQNARNKSLFRIKWIECSGVNFGVVTKFKLRYSIVKFLLVWLNQLTGLHPPLTLVERFSNFCHYFSRLSEFPDLSATIHKTLETNSSYYVKQRTTGKVQLLFSSSFLIILTNFILGGRPGTRLWFSRYFLVS